MSTDEQRNGFDISLQDHMQEFKRWAETTSIMNERISEMHRDTANLKYLPMIVDEIRELRGSLVNAATGKNHLPLAATIPVIAAMSFCIAVLGGLLFTFHTQGRSVSLSPTSIELSNGTNSPAPH